MIAHDPLHGFGRADFPYRLFERRRDFNPPNNALLSAYHRSVRLPAFVYRRRTSRETLGEGRFQKWRRTALGVVIARIGLSGRS
jgi:hypothetical protein